jgi:hypothetical protein
MFALAFCVTAKADYGAYPARAYIEHPDSGELHDQEKSVMGEMDAAISELESVIRICAGLPD